MQDPRCRVRRTSHLATGGHRSSHRRTREAGRDGQTRPYGPPLTASPRLSSRQRLPCRLRSGRSVATFAGIPTVAVGPDETVVPIAESEPHASHVALLSIRARPLVAASGTLMYVQPRRSSRHGRPAEPGNASRSPTPITADRALGPDGTLLDLAVHTRTTSQPARRVGVDARVALAVGGDLRVPQRAGLAVVVVGGCQKAPSTKTPSLPPMNATSGLPGSVLTCSR